MNTEDLKLQKLRLEMAANAITKIEIAQTLLKQNPNDPECITIHSQAVEQYEWLMHKITSTHQQTIEA